MRVVTFFIILFFAVSAEAELMAHKLYADRYEKESEVRSVLTQPELAIVQVDRSDVPCVSEEKFGVLYILDKPKEIRKKNQRLKVIHRWHHPDIEINSKTFTDEPVKLRFGQYYSEPRFAAFQLSELLLFNTTISLEVLHEDESLLKHEFTIACEESTSDMKLICKEASPLGSRIKTSQCRTRDQQRLERDSARERLLRVNIRNPDSSQ